MMLRSSIPICLYLLLTGLLAVWPPEPAAPAPYVPLASFYPAPVKDSTQELTDSPQIKPLLKEYHKTSKVQDEQLRKAEQATSVLEQQATIIDSQTDTMATLLAEKAVRKPWIYRLFQKKN